MTTTYDASVGREGAWWIVRVPAVNGVTQARRLSDVPLMARELVAATLDVPLDAVSINVHHDPYIVEKVADINNARAHAADLEREASKDARELARFLVKTGVPLRDVGTILGVSHQRAHQLVSDH